MTSERFDKINTVLQNRQCNTTVVLENVNDPHNISAVMRSCDAVGIHSIYILNTKIPQHKKFGDRSSSSANKWMRVQQFTEVTTCVQALRKHFDILLCAYLDPQAQNLYHLDLTKKTALIFGNEVVGISDELKAQCDGSFLIPQIGMIQSLNISVACAVSIYEAFRQQQEQPKQIIPLPVTEQKSLFHTWAYPNLSSAETNE